MSRFTFEIESAVAKSTNPFQLIPIPVNVFKVIIILFIINPLFHPFAGSGLFPGAVACLGCPGSAQFGLLNAHSPH